MKDEKPSTRMLFRNVIRFIFSLQAFCLLKFCMVLDYTSSQETSLPPALILACELCTYFSTDWAPSWVRQENMIIRCQAFVRWVLVSQLQLLQICAHAELIKPATADSLCPSWSPSRDSAAVRMLLSLASKLEFVSDLNDVRNRCSYLSGEFTTSCSVAISFTLLLCVEFDRWYNCKYTWRWCSYRFIRLEELLNAFRFESIEWIYKKTCY